jgi:hypothetical protein
MQLTFLQGYPDYIGKRLAICGYGTGPALYVTGGDSVVMPRYNNYIDCLFPALTVSGTYYVWPILASVGNRPTYKLKWVVASTGAEVAANTVLSGESVQIGGFGGVY